MDSKMDALMEAAIAKEKQATSQSMGRDGSLKLSLLSELKITSPIAFMVRRALYRLESAMGSISNRIYALLTTVVFLLVLSAAIFIAGTFLDDNEWNSLRADAGVDGDDDGSDGAGFRTTVLYALWLTWCFFVDPGSHTQKLDHTRYRWARVTSALISILGILFFSLVLGFVVDLLASFITRVTEGSNTVVEEGHYLILGYSEKCVAVIGELATAMESDGGGVVVVLADSPTKKEFDVMMRSHMNFLGLSNKTRVVFRVGNPLLTSNIAKVSPETSRAIILLSDSRMDADHADASVLHMILSLKSLIGNKGHVDRRVQAPDIGIFAEYERQNSFNDDPRDTYEEEETGVESEEVRKFGENNPRNNQPRTTILPHMEHKPAPVAPIAPSPERAMRRGSSFARLFGSDALSIARNDKPVTPPLLPAAPPPSFPPPMPDFGSNYDDGVYEMDDTDTLGKSSSIKEHWSNAGYLYMCLGWIYKLISFVVSLLCCCCRSCYAWWYRGDQDEFDFDNASDGSWSRDSEIHHPNRSGPVKFSGHVVAELQDNDNRPIIQVSGGSLVELVVIHDIIGRMLAKSVVQPNIRRIYDELLGFDGCEFYFARHSELDGCTFREASLRLQGAVLVGVKRGGDIMLNPDSALPSAVTSRHHHLSSGVLRKKFRIEPGDEVIVIAEDDSSYMVLDRPIFDDRKCARPWPPLLPLKSALDVALDKECEQSKRDAMAAVMEAIVATPIYEGVKGEQGLEDEAEILSPPNTPTLIDPHYSGEKFNGVRESGESKEEEDEDNAPRVDKDDDRLYTEMSLDHMPEERPQCDDLPIASDQREVGMTPASPIDNGANVEMVAEEEVKEGEVKEGEVKEGEVKEEEELGESFASWSPSYTRTNSYKFSQKAKDLESEDVSSPLPIFPISPKKADMENTYLSDEKTDRVDGLGSIGSIGSIGSMGSETEMIRRRSRRASLGASVDFDEMDRLRVEGMASASLEMIRQRAIIRFEESKQFEQEYKSMSPDKYMYEHSMGRSSPNSSVLSSPGSALSGDRADGSRGINVLMCGWRRDVKDMLRLMDKCLPRGSSVHILCEKSSLQVEEYLRDHCHNLRMDIRHSNGRADIRRRLVEYDALGFKFPANAVDVIVVVTDEAKEKDLLMSDSQTLACCLLVRDVQADYLENRDVSLTDLSVPRLEALQVSCPMTCEVLDVATRSTIEENPSIKALAEFVVVNDLAARLIAAVADRREVAAVLGELLGPDSQDIFVVESRELLYEDEVVPNRAAACVEVGDSPMRSFQEMELLSGLAAGESVNDNTSSIPSQHKKKHSFTHAFRRSSLFQPSTVKKTYVRPVSFVELSKRAAAPPRRGILLGYIKASWDGSGRGELVTVFNPKAKSAPLYWHARDFLIIMSLEEQSDPKRVGHRLTVVR